MDSVFVVHLTDLHLFAEPGGVLSGVNTDESLDQVLRDLKRDLQDQDRKPDLILITGDLSQDGSAQAYSRVKNAMQAFQVPLAVLPGNHDLHSEFQHAWTEQMGPVLDVRQWRIVLLDSVVPGSNAGYLEQDQLALLAQASAQAGGRHVLLALHHNPVVMKPAEPDDMMLANAQALFTVVCEQPAVRAILWGHVHQPYDQWLMCDAKKHTSKKCPHEQPEKRIRLLATPSTCVQFGDLAEPKDEQPGYRLMYLRPDGGIETQVKRVSAES